MRSVTRPPFREIRLLVTIMSVMLGFVWLVVHVAIEDARKAAETDALRDMQAVNKVVAEQVLRSITAVDYAVRLISNDLNENGRPTRLAELVARGAIRMDTLVLLSQVDAQGYLLGTNNGPSIPVIDLSDREHIRVHLDRKTSGLFIGKPVQGRASGKWSIQLSRAMTDAENRLTGVVVASMDPHYFERFWQKVGLNRDYRIELVGDDGVVRASSLDVEAELMAGARRMALVGQAMSVASGVFVPPAKNPAAAHVTRFQRIEGLPLILTTSIDRTSMQSGANAIARQYVLMGASTTCALMLAFFILCHRTVQLYHERGEAVVARQRLRDAIEAIPEGFALFDADDRLVSFNSAYKQIYNTSSDLVKEGALFEDMVRAGAERGQYLDAVGRVDEWVAERVRSHRNPTGSFEQHTDEGRWLRIEERRTGDGGIVGIRTDLTGVKQRELALARQTALLTATFEHMSEGLSVIDAEGRMVAFNRRFSELVDYPETQEVKGVLLTELLAMFGQNAHIMPEGINGDGELALRDSMARPGKAVEWVSSNDRIVELNTSPLPDGGYVTIYNDVTESRRNSHRIEASEALKSAMIAASLDAIVITDDHGIIREFNTAAEDIFGWSASEAIGHPVIDIIVPVDIRTGQPLASLQDLDIGMSSRVGQRFEVAARHRSGRVFPTEITLAAIALHGRRSLSAFIRDISERRRIDEDMRLAREAAEAANAAKSEFLAMVSHEVRTPMNGIIGLSRLLVGTRLDDEQMRFSRGIQDSADRLLILINEILEFSRIEAGRLQIDIAPFDLPRLVESAIDTTRVLIAEKPVEVRAVVDPDVPAILMGDSTRLYQIIHNLLANSAKFTERGEIAIRVLSRPGCGTRIGLRLEVADTGPGIPEDIKPRLFTPFEQGRADVARRHGGSGLGLVICRRLIELMGGRIGLDSREGVGSTFWIEIELDASSEPLADRPAGQVLLPSNVPPLDILVAEDTPTSQLVIRSLLEKLGHRVQVVSDGAEAVSAAAASRCDLILMDLQMPVMDGLEAAGRIRALPAATGRTPIYALTAQAHSGTLERITAAGMNGHLTKPISTEHLQVLLAEIAAQRTFEIDHPVLKEIDVPDTADALGETLDRAALTQLLDAVGEVQLRALIRHFAVDAADALDQMDAALAVGDCAALRSLAHKLCGLFGQFGLPLAADGAAETESAASDERCLSLARQLTDAGRRCIDLPATFIDGSAPRKAA